MRRSEGRGLKEFPVVSALPELGWAILLARACVHQPAGFPSSVAQRSLWKLHHRSVIDMTLHLQPRFLSQRLEAEEG